MPKKRETPLQNVMSPAMTYLFAISGGVAVGSLYLAQPLLNLLAKDLHASSSVASLLVTLTQIGYAVGIVLVVPLGDVRDRRRLITIMMLLAAASLAVCAVAPTIAVLFAALTTVGLTAVTGQILTPLAGDLADDAHRGRIVGTVVSGLLAGILISRTISGLVAGVAGWRTIFAVAALLDVILGVILLKALPQMPPKASIPYGKLLTSIGRAITTERAVRWTLVLGATAFGTFTMLWTALTFLLSAPPFTYPVSLIGLFGLAGLAGTLAAGPAGRLHDKGWNLPATGLAWGLALLSFALAAVAGHSLLVVIAVLVLFDIAVQGINILNQSRIFSLSDDARSRLNTAFVTSNFIGGAVGSAVAGILWSVGGWQAVVITGLGSSCFGLLVWALGRKKALRI